MPARRHPSQAIAGRAARGVGSCWASALSGGSRCSAPWRRPEAGVFAAPLAHARSPWYQTAPGAGSRHSTRNWRRLWRSSRHRRGNAPRSGSRTPRSGARPRGLSRHTTSTRSSRRRPAIAFARPQGGFQSAQPQPAVLNDDVRSFQAGRRSRRWRRHAHLSAACYSRSQLPRNRSRCFPAVRGSPYPAPPLPCQGVQYPSSVRRVSVEFRSRQLAARTSPVYVQCMCSMARLRGARQEDSRVRRRKYQGRSDGTCSPSSEAATDTLSPAGARRGRQRA